MTEVQENWDQKSPRQRLFQTLLIGGSILLAGALIVIFFILPYVNGIDGLFRALPNLGFLGILVGLILVSALSGNSRNDRSDSDDCYFCDGGLESCDYY